MRSTKAARASYKTSSYIFTRNPNPSSLGGEPAPYLISSGHESGLQITYLSLKGEVVKIGNKVLVFSLLLWQWNGLVTFSKCNLNCGRPT